MQLNRAQIKAVTAKNPRLLIIAGAGSGKTQVIIERIHYLINELNINASAILALTFTNKAAYEMKERSQVRTSSSKFSYFTTFHSFGARFLREHASLLEMSRYFSIYDDRDQLAILKRLYADEPQSQLIEWRHYINRAKDYALNPDDLATLHTYPKQFSRVFQSYQSSLRLHHAVDFGDLIYLPLQLLSEHPQLLALVQKQWQAILVDEYQDTNIAQALLLEHLTGNQSLLTAVGDEDQAIYSFRGADTYAILNFSERFSGTEIIKLEQNYRSQAHILSCANKLIAHNKHRLGKTLFTNNISNNPVHLHYFINENDEVKWITQQIQQLPDTTTKAILYRTNAQSRLFELALNNSNIPYQLIGNVHFYDREEIKLSLQLLTLLVNPLDQSAFSRLFTTPSRGVGAKSLQKIFDICITDKHSSLFEASKQTKLSTKAQHAVTKISQLYKEFNKKIESGEKLTLLLDYMLTHLSIYEYYQKKDTDEGSDRVANLTELVNALSDYEGGKQELALFLEATQLDSSHGSEDLAFAVKLTTIHNTKGLEYDAVFLTGMEQHLFPKTNSSSHNFESELEEERRLCYVALTRARNLLHITYAQERRLYGKMNYQQPSQFLQELYIENAVESHNHHPQGTVEQQGQQQMLDYRVGAWVYDELYGVGQITTLEWSRAGHLVLSIQFKNKLAKILPAFRQLEPISSDYLED